MSDLISRQAVDDVIYDYSRSHAVDYAQIMGYIDKIPSVENKGEWIHPYRSDIACECSVCHMQMPITDYFHYCPNCGARMKGGE